MVYTYVPDIKLQFGTLLAVPRNVLADPRPRHYPATPKEQSLRNLLSPRSNALEMCGLAPAFLCHWRSIFM